MHAQTAYTLRLVDENKQLAEEIADVRRVDACRDRYGIYGRAGEWSAMRCNLDGSDYDRVSADSLAALGRALEGR